MMKILAVLLLLSTNIGAAPCQVPTPRRPETIREFKRLTGYPRGRPGWVVDHIVPLCACGDDAVYNLQWQEKKASLAKDRFERETCAALRKARMKK